MRKLLIGLVAALSFGSAANAATIVNGSFENSSINPGGFTTVNAGSPVINGWSVGGASVDYIGSYWTAQNGARSIDLAGSGIGNISQVIATVVGQLYNVSFYVSRNPDGGITPRTGFVDVGGSQTLITFGNAASGPTNMAWELKNYTFTAAATNTTLRFSADPATSGSAYGMALDNVMIAAVPEPATWLMMLFGFGLIGGALRSRKKQMTFA